MKKFLILGLCLTTFGIYVSKETSSWSKAAERKREFISNPSTKLIQNCPFAFEAFDELMYKSIIDKNELSANNSKPVTEQIFNQYLSQFERSSIYKKLQSEKNKRDNCGADALQTLMAYYQMLGVKNKEADAHASLMELADANIPQAIFALCEDGKSENESKNYCKLFIDGNDNNYPATMKEIAGDKLADTITMTNKNTSTDDLDMLALECNKSKSSHCIYQLDLQANGLNLNGDKQASKKYYTIITRFVENEIINKENKSITDTILMENLPFYYSSSEQDVKLSQYCSELYDKNNKSCVFQITVLAESLMNEHEYQRAFNLFKQVVETIDIPESDKNSLAAQTDAQTNIGWFYQNGYGTEKNSTLAIYYYNQAIPNADRQTKILALYNLSRAYYDTNDFIGSFRAAKQAAELGNIDAQAELSIYYYSGTGTVQDFEEAYAWSCVALSSMKNSTKLTNYIKYVHDRSKLQLIFSGKLIEGNQLAKKYYDNSAYGAVVGS